MNTNKTLKNFVQHIIEDNSSNNTNNNNNSSSNSSSLNEIYLLLSINTLNINNILYELKRRGFIPLYYLQINTLYIIILTLSSKLFTKLAIINNFPLVNQNKSSLLHKIRIYYQSRKIILRSNIKPTNIWLMHQKEKLSQLGGSASTTCPDLKELNQYFGSQIALYFGWLDFYSSYLKYPAFFGVLLFTYQIFTGNVDTPWNSYFLLFSAVWSTCFLEFWKQRNAILTNSWGVLHVDDEQHLRQIAKTIGVPQPDRLFRFAITIPTILVMILGLLRLMTYFIHLMDTASDTYGSSLLAYWPTIVYSLLPVVAGAIYEPVAVLLNNFECHRTPVEEEYYLIIKQFAFQFVNRYSALIYTAFYLHDLARLRTLLASMLITNALLDNFMEIFSPYINKLTTLITEKLLALWAKRKSKSQTPEQTQPPVDKTPIGKVLESTLTQEEADKKWKDDLLTELKMEEYNLRSDYLELILQYGYVTMFAVVFPIAPVLAYLNNLMEAKVDFVKLARSKRPPLQDRSSIGAWFTCLSILNYAAVLSNCYLLCIVSKNVKYSFPESYHNFFDLEYNRFVLLVVLEHILLLLKMILSIIIEDIPREVEENQAKVIDKIKKKMANERLMLYIQQANGQIIVNNTNSSSDYHSERKVVAAKLSTEAATPLGYTSLFLTGALSFPFLMESIGISPSWYIPLSSLILSYLKADKNRKDYKSAIQVVSDYHMLKYSISEIPSWVQNSNVQTVKWLNDTLSKLWPSISLATEAVIKQTLQPILDQNCPPYLTSLAFSRITLGTIAPVIVGIRHCETEEKCIRLDIELKWAGNPEIVLDVGYKTLPLSIELSDIRLSTVLRVEFYGLIPNFPCFEAITLSCMHKPFIDFSFEIGSLNVMNLGAAEYNVANGVNTLIRSIISSFALHPIKYVVYNSGERKNFNELIPIAVVKLNIISAKNLKVADFLTSDPYVQIKFMDKVEQTKIVYKTLNPVWNETFNIPVFDKETQFIELIVYDYDVGMPPDFLGKLTINLDTLPINELKEMDLSLNEVNTGTIQFTCEYSPFKRGKSSNQNSSSNNTNNTNNLESELFYEFSNNTFTCDDLTIEDGHLLSDLLDNESSLNSMNGNNYKNNNGNRNSTSILDSNNINDTNSTKLRPFKDSLRMSRRGMSGLLSISNIKGLHFKGHSILSTLKPYVVFIVGNSKNSTAVHKVTSDSDVVFDETFHITVQDPLKSSLIIKVMHDNLLRGDSLLGEVVVPLTDLMKEDDPFTRVYSIYDKMELSVEFTWSATA